MRFLSHIHYKRKYATILLLILAGGILLSSFHYHEDGAILDDCPVCRFQDSGVAATSIDIVASVEPASIVNQEVICEPEIVVAASTRPIETLPNAPPSIS